MALREIIAKLGFDVDEESINKYKQHLSEAKGEMKKSVEAGRQLEQKNERLRSLGEKRILIAKELAMRERESLALKPGSLGAEKNSIQRDKLTEQLKANAFEAKKAKTQLGKLLAEYMELGKREKDVEKTTKAIEDQGKALKKTQKRLDRYNDAMDTAQNLGGHFQTGLLGGVAALGALVVGLGLSTRRTAEYSEEVIRSSEALQSSVATYQQYRFAFRALGASQDDLMDAFSTITDRAKDAIEGSKTYAKEFQRVGIAVSSLKGKKPIELFEMYTKAAKNAKDKTQVLTSAVRLFGDDLGRRIMPALVGSSENFDKFMQIAKSTGIVLSEQLVRQSQRAQFSMRLLEATVLGLVRRLGAEMAPTMKHVADRALTFIQKMSDLGIITKIFNGIVKGVTGQVLSFMNAANGLYQRLGVNGLLGVVKALGVALAVVGTTLSGAAFLKGVGGLLTLVGGGAAFLQFAVIVGVVGVALAGLYLVLTDIRSMFDGERSFFGSMAEKSPKVKEALERLRVAGSKLLASLGRLGESFANLFVGFDDERKASLLEFFSVATVEGITEVTDRLTTFTDGLSVLMRVAERVATPLMFLLEQLAKINDELEENQMLADMLTTIASGGLANPANDRLMEQASGGDDAKRAELEGKTERFVSDMAIYSNPAASALDSGRMMFDAEYRARRTGTNQGARAAGNTTTISQEVNVTVQGTNASVDEIKKGVKQGSDDSVRQAKNALASGPR